MMDVIKVCLILFNIILAAYIPIHWIPLIVEKPRCNADHIYVFRLDWNQMSEHNYTAS